MGQCNSDCPSGYIRVGSCTEGDHCQLGGGGASSLAYGCDKYTYKKGPFNGYSFFYCTNDWFGSDPQSKVTKQCCMPGSRWSESAPFETHWYYFGLGEQHRFILLSILLISLAIWLFTMIVCHYKKKANNYKKIEKMKYVKDELDLDD